MKRIKYILFALILPAMVYGQNNTETIKKSFSLDKIDKELWFCVCNIEGDIEVEAYDGNTVEVEVSKRITARNEADIQQGMKDIQVEFLQGDGFVRARVSSPYNRYRGKDDPLACGWDWHSDEGKVRYSHRLDFKVKVPRAISVKISTVNDSELYVKGVKGEVYASNVNGDVTLIDIANNTKASTVNGKIKVNYTTMPSEFADFQTVNGDITVQAPDNAKAIFNFESQWGKVYSDFEFSQKLAPKMVANDRDGGGTMYKISNSNSYQVGDGGATFSFKTLNGDIMIRKDK